jgi:predicted phage tail protein
MILTGAAIWIAGVSKTYTPAICVTGAAIRIAGVSDYTPAMILTGAAMFIAGVWLAFSPKEKYS